MYDRNGQLLSKVNIDGALTWKRDFFGHELQHIDLGGAMYVSRYDHKWQQVLRYSFGGDHGKYYPFNPATNHFSSDPIPTPGQDISNTYLAGKLVRTDDAAKGQSTIKEYDAEGRIIASQILMSDGTILQKVNSRLDAIGRVTWTYDTNAEIAVGFDENGNRRYVGLTVHTKRDPVSKQQWYTYDVADRTVIDSGVLQRGSTQNGTIVITPDQGTILSYVNNFRNQQITLDSSKNKVPCTLSYDDDGRLTKITYIDEDGPTYRHQKYLHRTFNSSGRIEDCNDHDYTETYDPWPINKGHWVHKDLYYDLSTTKYNANGEITKVYQSELASPDAKSSSATTEYDHQGYTADGEPLHQYTAYSGDANVSIHLDNKDTKFDGLQLGSTSGYVNDDYGNKDCSTVRKSYGPNAELEAIGGCRLINKQWMDGNEQ